MTDFDMRADIMLPMIPLPDWPTDWDNEVFCMIVTLYTWAAMLTGRTYIVTMEP